MVLTDGSGLPLSAQVHSASPAEVTLIEDLIDHQKVPGTPAHLIYDRAADSDPLRERLKARGIDLVCPHRKSRKKPPTQDGRKLRRYKRRYRIERTNSWLQNFKRLVLRMEHKVHNYVGLVHLACVMIVMRRFV
jgi:transposase